MLADSLQASVAPLGRSGLSEWLKQLVAKYDRLDGIAVFDLNGKVNAAVNAISKRRPTGEFLAKGGKDTYVYVPQIETAEKDHRRHHPYRP